MLADVNRVQDIVATKTGERKTDAIAEKIHVILFSQSRAKHIAIIKLYELRKQNVEKLQISLSQPKKEKERRGRRRRKETEE